MNRSLPDFVAVDWHGTVVAWLGGPPYPGALETLERLARSGATLVVLSAARQAVLESEVDRLGLRADEVIGSVEKARVLADLKLRYGRGLVLGDHPQDQEAAQEAGLTFIQARLERQFPIAGRDGAFESWGELRALLCPSRPAGAVARAFNA